MGIHNKSIVVIEAPFAFVDYPLCPMDQVSIETLKVISLLKKDNNKVLFIDMRSNESFLWKKRCAGIEGATQIQTSLRAKPQKYLVNELRKIENKPDEVIIMCNIAFAPYSFDEEVIDSLIGICETECPKSKVNISGNFIHAFPEFLENMVHNDTSVLKFEDIDNYEPCFIDDKKWRYGLFQLVKGCANKCSFCTAGLEKPKKIPIKFVIEYMKKLYDKSKPETFLNWDPNVLMYPEYMENFLDEYIKSRMGAKLSFDLGFQPNLINERIIEKIAKIGIDIVTIPFESGDSETNKKIGKPYTLISSIKKLDMIKKHKSEFRRIQSSFIIGYPYDDFQSIFRIYISIIKMGSVPIPFPLFVFPRTAEYERNKEKLNKKRFSELHGQLWPLINKEDIHVYQKLLKFLLIPNLKSAIDNIDLLHPKLKKIFLKELKISDKFIEMCLNSESDSADELKKIEGNIEFMQNDKLVYISVSPKKSEYSASRQLGEYFMDSYLKMNPDDEVERIDLYKEGIDYINEEFIDFIYGKKKYENLSGPTLKQINLADKYIKMLKAADKIIIATPMWTLSIPAILKSFFEMISSRLFYSLNEKIPKKQVVCIITRDGIYTKYGNERNDDAQINVQEKMIIAAFGFMGMGKDIGFIYSEGMFDKRNAKDSIQNAKRDIDSFLIGF